MDFFICFFIFNNSVVFLILWWLKSKWWWCVRVILRFFVVFLIYFKFGCCLDVCECLFKSLMSLFIFLLLIDWIVFFVLFNDILVFLIMIRFFGFKLFLIMLFECIVKFKLVGLILIM